MSSHPNLVCLPPVALPARLIMPCRPLSTLPLSELQGTHDPVSRLTGPAKAPSIASLSFCTLSTKTRASGCLLIIQVRFIIPLPLSPSLSSHIDLSAWIPLLVGAIMTTLARDHMPVNTPTTMTDTPELAAGYSLWLATQGDLVDFLRGRYSCATVSLCLLVHHVWIV